ncbi:hypothetical protein L6452_42970 [Arctium lappa]|uniref:Uncharacterized protein n=1 Tax=Arctium lappa TaxID=4217 RepID=A0ACB8XK35_ARCLA|nr:hypothetical protein L6452_42970 [Arctium lappa]
MSELTENYAYYFNVIGNNECQRIYAALNWFEKGAFAPHMRWIVMPEMGILTASRFNVILHVLSMEDSATYLPFRTHPSSSSQDESITIVHVNGNHYIKVVLNRDYPMPTLVPHWTHHVLPDARSWIIPYKRRLDMYEEYIERTRTRDYVDLNE